MLTPQFSLEPSHAQVGMLACAYPITGPPNKTLIRPHALWHASSRVALGGQKLLVLPAIYDSQAAEQGLDLPLSIRPPQRHSLPWHA